MVQAARRDMRDNRRTRVVLGLLLLASFTLITLDLRGGSSLPAGLRSGVSRRVRRRAERRAVGDRPDRRLLRPGHAQRRARRIDELEQENAALRRSCETTDDARHRADELDDLLKVAGLGSYQILPAQVIAVGPAQGFDWTVEIDAGIRDGLTADMTVINGDGLVGRVKSVTASTATVVLLVDPELRRSACALEGNGQLGLLTGRAIAPMQLVSCTNPGHASPPATGSSPSAR